MRRSAAVSRARRLALRRDVATSGASNKKPRGRTGCPVALVVVRFSVGERLSAPLRISVRPVGRCVREPSHPEPSSRSKSWVPSLQSRPFAWSGERRVDEAIRCRQLQPSMMRCTSETERLLSRSRMRTPRGPSRTLWSLHRITSTSDVLFVTPRHARVGIRIRPMRCPTSA
jgi:hypothetical protein